MDELKKMIELMVELRVHAIQCYEQHGFSREEAIAIILKDEQSFKDDVLAIVKTIVP